MNTEKYDPNRRKSMNYITVILVILVGLLSSFQRKNLDFSAYLTFHNEGYMTIRDEVGNAADISYRDIVSAEYVEAVDFGQPAGGSIVNEELRLGAWTSDAFGTYWNCTETALESCVLIRTGFGVYAISHESEETTKGLQGAILDARDRLLAQPE